MYAKVDMYGLERGVFSKDKILIFPIHPHCLCHFAPIYTSKLKGKKIK